LKKAAKVWIIESDSDNWSYCLFFGAPLSVNLTAMKYILALDQGTTSSRAVLFNRNGQPVATAQQEFTQFFPKPGWVEHDALEIWQSQKNVMQEVLQKARVSSSQIQSIGITNQRETSVVWDRRTGQPIAPAIVWQDRRTAGLCDKLKSQGAAAGIQKKTGLVLDAYFSATKIAWLLDHGKGARRLAEQGHLAFGTIDTWLIWQLTGGRVHVTDPSNASRTMLFNLHTQAWDASLLKQFNIGRNRCASFGCVGAHCRLGR
jgi:glycerol kinase